MTDFPITEEPTVTLSLDVARKLYEVYRVWWHVVDTTDPGKTLTVDGTVVTGIVGLLGVQDGWRMDDAAGAVEPHEHDLRYLLYPGGTS